jgi:hypothetical protein
VVARPPVAAAPRTRTWPKRKFRSDEPLNPGSVADAALRPTGAEQGPCLGGVRSGAVTIGTANDRRGRPAKRLRIGASWASRGGVFLSYCPTRLATAKRSDAFQRLGPEAALT